MKVSTAKKIKSALNDVLNVWSVDQGGAYVFSSPQVYITIGKPNGTDCKLVNTETIGAKTLDDCLRLDFSEPFKSRLYLGTMGQQISLGENVCEHVQHAMFACGTERRAVRNYQAKVFFTSDGITTRIAGTDSFYLFEGISNTPSNPFNFLLEEKLCRVFIELFKGKEITTRLSEDKTALEITSGDILATFRTSHIKYPNYRSVIPDKTNPIDLCSSEADFMPVMTPKKDLLLKIEGNKISVVSCKDEKAVFGRFEVPVHLPKTKIQQRYYAMASKFAGTWSQTTSDEPILLRSYCNTMTAVIVPITERSAS